MERLQRTNEKKPGLYVHPARYERAKLMVRQPLTLENAMEWGGVLGMDVYADDKLCNKDDWYIIEPIK